MLKRGLSFLFSAILMGQGPSTTMALCTKSVGSVTRDGAIRQGEIQKGSFLYSGDKITIGDSSFFSFINLNDRSNVKVYGNSIVKLLFEQNGEITLSEIALFGGKLSAELEKTDKREFLVHTPISTASVKGTHFLAEHRTMDHHGPHYQGMADCVFSVISGLVEVENTKSGKSILLKKGKTVISTPDGEFHIFKTTDAFTNHYKEPE